MGERIVQQKKVRRAEQPAFRHLAPDTMPHEDQPVADPRSFTKPLFGHDFSQISVLPPSTATLQTKLTVNEPGDQFEQEADQVAEEVMRMKAPGDQSAASRYAGEHIQRKAPSGDPSVVSPELQATIDGMRGGGQPLDQASRDFMEPRFGHSFANVHVHTDDRAVEASQAVNALAFTIGQDIAFNAGQYQPNSATGRRLLAHELTHVVQQTGMVQAQPIDSSPPQASNAGTGNTIPALQRVENAFATNNLDELKAIQRELRKQMLTDPLHPPEDARAGLATARHLTMDRIAAIRDTYATRLEAARTGGSTGTDGTAAVEALEVSMDTECTPYLDVLMEGDPQYRYEHFNTIVSEKVFSAVRLHSERRAVGQIGHRDEAEAEARSHGKVPKGTQPSDAWCGAFAYTQAEQAGGFDQQWVVHMQGEGGIRSALAYTGGIANPWIWVFDHWEKLKEYHAFRGSVRRYEAIENAPPRQGIQAGDLVLIDNNFGTYPDHVTTAISFDGRFLTTVGGNQGGGEAGVSRSGHAIDLQNNPSSNDVRKKDAEGKRIDHTVDPNQGPKNVRVHGIGRWSVVDYERHVYSKQEIMPAAPPSAANLAKLG